MDFHKLLQKQIQTHLTAECVENPTFKSFIKTVNDTYIAFERDKNLMNQSFKESEKEYNEINEHLKKENELKQQSISNLYDSLDALDENHEDIKAEEAVDNLLFISKYLNTQIEKRKESEKNLLNNIELLKTLLANLQTGIMVEDDKHQVLFVNQFFCDMRKLSFSPEELVGLNNADLIHKSKLLFKDPESFVSRIYEIVTEKEIVVEELVEAKNDVFFERTYAPIFINDKLIGHLWKYSDVTERIHDRKKLEQSEELTRTIMDSALNGIAIVDQNGDITFLNTKAQSLLGWTIEEVKGKRFVDFMIPERNKHLWEIGIKQYLTEGFNNSLNKQIELLGIKKNGDEFIAEISITAITQNGETFFCAFFQDITKRKETENQLLQTAELLKTILVNRRTGVLVEDENQKIVYSNQLYWDIRNPKILAQDVEGFDYSTFYEKSKFLFKDPERYVKRIEELLNNKTAVIKELIETADNRYLERDFVPIYIDNEYRGHLWEYTDVTQKIDNQNLLRQSESLSRLIMNASMDCIITIDTEGLITFWNRKSETLFGWKKREVLGKPLAELIIPIQHSGGILYHSNADEGPILNKTFETTALNKIGHEFPIEISIIPITRNGETFFVSFIHDISSRKKVEKIRQIQEEKYQNIITKMKIGIIEVNNNGKIFSANDSFNEISGFETAELIGRKPSEIFIFGENFEIINTFQKDIQKVGVPGVYQIPIKNKRGEVRWWEVSRAPNYDENENLIGTIGIHLDITEQKQLEIELEKEKFKAIDSSKAKETFLANMSHEIRTPLNAIIGFLRELSKQELNDLQRKYIDNSTVASKHLLAIINNILDMSKIEAGEMSLEEENFVFEKSISNVSTILQPLMEQKGIELKVFVSEGIKKTLKGDMLRLQQVLFNLVGNAIKFTGKGSISINCDVVNDNSIFQELKISVTDTGIGMDQSFVENIFTKFSQEDKSTTRKYGGTGLGLSITRELVKLMDGRIEIQSEKHKGTTIDVFIRFLLGDQDDIKIEDAVKEVPRIDNISILLVEDNYLNRMIAQNSLQYYDCKVTEAVNGLEAIEILKYNKFDIILMDVQMPEMGGIEATEIIRNKLNIKTPIIAFTANAFKTEIDKCKQAGMDDFISKPFEEEYLIELIAKHTVNKIVKPQEKEQYLSLVPVEEEKLYNLTQLLNLSRGDIELVLKMTKVFIDQTNDTIVRVENAIGENNFSEVARLIHSMKPSIERIGLHSIADDVALLAQIDKKTTKVKDINLLFDTVKETLIKTIIQLNEVDLNR